MDSFLPEGYRWATAVEKIRHKKGTDFTGSIRVPVSNVNSVLTKRLAVPKG